MPKFISYAREQTHLSYKSGCNLISHIVIQSKEWKVSKITGIPGVYTKGRESHHALGYGYFTLKTTNKESNHIKISFGKLDCSQLCSEREHTAVCFNELIWVFFFFFKFFVWTKVHFVEPLIWLLPLSNYLLLVDLFIVVQQHFFLWMSSCGEALMSVSQQ